MGCAECGVRASREPSPRAWDAARWVFPPRPSRLGQLLPRVVEGQRGSPHPLADRAGPGGGGQLGSRELPEHQGQPHRRGTLEGPQCPWDFWSLAGCWVGDSPLWGPRAPPWGCGFWELPALKVLTSSPFPAWPSPCSLVPGPPSPGPWAPWSYLQLSGSSRAALCGGRFGDARLRLRSPIPEAAGQCGAGLEPQQTRARVWRARACCWGDGFGSRTRPKPNSRPGRRGGREEEEGRSGMRLGEGMPCSGAPPSHPEPHWELISLPGDVKLARALWPESSC